MYRLVVVRRYTSKKARADRCRLRCCGTFLRASVYFLFFYLSSTFIVFTSKNNIIAYKVRRDKKRKVEYFYGRTITPTIFRRCPFAPLNIPLVWKISGDVPLALPNPQGQLRFLFFLSLLRRVRACPNNPFKSSL